MGNVTLPAIGKITSLGILFALLPGLLVFVIVRALTSRERKLDGVEAVLHGLVYTLVVHATWEVLKLPGSYIPTPDIVGLSLTAAVIGCVISVVLNRGHAYRLFRFLGITDQSSWPGMWNTSFREATDSVGGYAAFTLRDRRRIMGYIVGYSDVQDGGHICLERARWLVDPEDEDVDTQTELAGLFLICADDVQFVHFVPEESDDETIN